MRINVLLLTCFMALASQFSMADNTDFTTNRTDFRDESIYFLMTTRFYDGDPTNNVLCWDYQSKQIEQGDPFWRGDLAGVIEKLDYIKALGFTAIWITPIVQNASGVDYHGYHAMDHSSEDLRLQSHKGKGKYGGFQGISYNGDTYDDVSFQTLIDAAHKKGIKIILDLVLNHTGNFGEVNLCHEFDRSQNILNQADIDKSMLPDYSVLPGEYLTEPSGTQYQTRLALMKNTDGQNHDTHNYWHHYGSFNWDEPNRWWAQIAGDCVDLNTENPAVIDYLVKCYGKFIAMGVDGFRIDTSGHISRLSYNSAFIPKLAALGEQYKSKRLNQTPFYMYGEVCARYQGSVTYRGQPNLSPWFYTWKSSQSDVDKFNSVTAEDWAGTIVKEGSDTPLNMAYCLTDNAHASNPNSNNVKMVNGAWHEPDYSESSGFNVIDFPMHYSFNDAASAYTYRNEDNYYNDASYNVVYVDSHDYCAGPNDGQRYNGGTAQWSENMDLMWTFRGIPCLFYGSEVEFKKGCKIDEGGVNGLANTGRAYYGGYITGDINATDFASYTASGNADITLSQDLSQHLMKLNRIRQAVPALRKGQWTNDGCTCNGAMAAFKRAYNKDGIDSYALVCISGGATFSNVPAGTYTELVTGQTYQGGGTITVTCPSNKGQLRVLVKNYTGKSGAALTGGDGKFMYATTSTSVAKSGWTDQEAGTDKYITADDAIGEAGVALTPNGGIFTTESLEVTATSHDCSSATCSINGGSAQQVSAQGTTFSIGNGDPYNTTYTVTWKATTNDGVSKSGSATFTKKDPAAGITIYVKANTAPYLYAWTNNGSVVKLNGSWPGTRMDATTKIGNDTYYYKTFLDQTSINIILDNGSSGSGNQTADITGITEDTYFTWDGGSGYEKITPTGIESLEKSNTTRIYKVYTLSGQQAAEVSDLHQAENILRRGVYVTNGHKFIVR